MHFHRNSTSAHQLQVYIAVSEGVARVAVDAGRVVQALGAALETQRVVRVVHAGGVVGACVCVRVRVCVCCVCVCVCVCVCNCVYLCLCKV